METVRWPRGPWKYYRRRGAKKKRPPGGKAISQKAAGVNSAPCNLAPAGSGVGRGKLLKSAGHKGGGELASFGEPRLPSESAAGIGQRV